jgi:hypothetical protein
MPKDRNGGWRLPTDTQALSLTDSQDSHPALGGEKARLIIGKLREKGADRCFVALGHYLDYVEWLKSATHASFTRRQIAYFRGRAARFADQIKAAHVEPEKARHFADKIEQLTSGVWGIAAEDAPAKLLHWRKIHNHPRRVGSRQAPFRTSSKI